MLAKSLWVIARDIGHRMSGFPGLTAYPLGWLTHLTKVLPEGKAAPSFVPRLGLSRPVPVARPKRNDARIFVRQPFTTWVP